MNSADILTPTIGQRWFAPLEPELGLGIVQDLDDQRITLLFEGLEEPRIYSRKAQQISRAIFHVGDKLKARGDHHFEITHIDAHEGLITYTGITDQNEDIEVSEIMLLAGASYNSPLERILGGLWEGKGLFKMRRKALAMQHELLNESTLGYLGARMTFLPHQISVANKAAQNGYRALLADEVGLGKTIEAGMILQRLVIRRDVSKVLIVTPKALSFQWFVEMLRRFNLHFNIIQDEWLNQGVDLFEYGQLFIVSEELFNHSDACEQLAQISWDMIVVDEVHHYDAATTPEAWAMLSNHAATNKPMLGLSATPDQGGIEKLFERLALLAPNHFQSLDDYTNALAAVTSDDHKEADLAVLGYGSYHFRNSRSMMSGFPERELNAIAVQAPEHYNCAELFAENADEIASDPRTHELVALIKANKRDKFLVITHNAATCEALEHHLRINEGIRSSDFHEHLDLVERDRASAYFADPDGAQVLICSEIGSEGRNFQFCHQLIMFDLPPQVSQLEQRIGRLDRIGQQQTITLTQLYFDDSAQSRLFDVYHKGFNAYLSLDSHNSLHEANHKSAIEAFVFEGQESPIDHLQGLQSSELSTSENLLAKHSLSVDEAETLLDVLYERDYSSSDAMRDWMQDLSQVYGLAVEELAVDRYSMQSNTQTDEEIVPPIDEEGIEVVCDRTIATSNEHLRFFTTEHPWFIELIDRITTTARGSSWVGKLALKSVPEGTIMLACNFESDDGQVDQRLWMGTTALSENITTDLLSKAKNVKANMALEWLRGQSKQIQSQLHNVQQQLGEGQWQLESLGVIICHQ